MTLPPRAERLLPELVDTSEGTSRITVDDDAFEPQPLALGSHSPGAAETPAGRQPA